MGLGERSITRAAWSTADPEHTSRTPFYTTPDITREQTKAIAKILSEPENADAINKKRGDKEDFKLPNFAGLIGHIMSPSLNKSSVSGSAGWLGYQKPFVTIINKRPVGTEDLNKYIGLPIETKETLGDLSGYTEVSEIFLPQDSLTTLSQNEIAEIKTLLNRGVVL